LSGADTSAPSFTPNLLGDYTAALVVVDSAGLESVPAVVIVSTVNSPPIADAGSDRALLTLGVAIRLGADPGHQSSDPDGDDIIYRWTLERPTDSQATLSDVADPTPLFIPDVYGLYTVSLIVTDEFGASSHPDQASISFTNLPPVADAGGNQGVTISETALLDGSGSSDPNNDIPLTYHWALTTKPGTSTAVLDKDDQVIAELRPDRAGTYVVSLIVNDGLRDSEADNATITATVTPSALIETIEQAIEAINGLPAGSVKNRNMKKALTNKLAAVLVLVDDGDYIGAFDKLDEDVITKTNGCDLIGEPDKNDWARTCEAQAAVHPVLMYAIALLEDILAQ
jgi:hypothetical protein